MRIYQNRDGILFVGGKFLDLVHVIQDCMALGVRKTKLIFTECLRIIRLEHSWTREWVYVRFDCHEYIRIMDKPCDLDAEIVWNPLSERKPTRTERLRVWFSVPGCRPEGFLEMSVIQYITSLNNSSNRDIIIKMSGRNSPRRSRWGPPRDQEPQSVFMYSANSRRHVESSSESLPCNRSSTTCRADVP